MKKQMPIVVLSLVGLLLAGCRMMGGQTIGNTCGDLGTSTEAQKVGAFIDTGARFQADTLELAANVESTCTAMANDLGVEIPSASEGQLQVDATCGAVATEIRSIIDASLPRGASLTLNYNPPVCSFELDAVAECVAECDANVSADVNVECTGGQLVGSCSGTCEGECRLEGTAACTAECAGTCTGSCEGTCNGACDGQCSAYDAQGNCIGTCSGTCAGTCSGTCSGSCEGTCTTSGTGTCSGTCAGSCDVAFEEPRCEGDATVQADAQCTAACDAEVQASASCTEPELSIYAGFDVDPAAEERLALLFATLEANYPRFLALKEQLSNLAESSAAVVTAFDGAADAAGDLGIGAAACFAGTTLGIAQSVATVDVTLSVSVEVSASVSAQAG